MFSEKVPVKLWKDIYKTNNMGLLNMDVVFSTELQ